jgi:death on curing protein
MNFIDFEEVEIFHAKIIEKTGGSKGIRDRGLIESALNKPFQTFDGKDLYNSILDKISAITFSLISNHGFIDGNKRIGVAVMIFLLRINNIEIKYSQKDLVELGLGVASGKIKESGIYEWIEGRIGR